MSEDPSFQELMRSLPAKATDLVVEINWLRAQNTGLRTEASILRKQRDDLYSRVEDLETSVVKHKNAEAELKEYLRRISDTFNSAETNSETNPMSNTMGFSPKTGQNTFFSKGTSKLSGSKRVTFGKAMTLGTSNAVKPASPSGTASSPKSSVQEKPLGTTTSSTLSATSVGAPFGAPLGSSPKSEYGKPQYDPFKTSILQETIPSFSGGGFFHKVSESAANGSKVKATSTSVGEASFQPSTENTSKAVDQKNSPGPVVPSFGGSFNGTSFGVKAEPVAETKETDKTFSPFGQNTQEKVTGALRTAFSPPETGASSTSTRGETSNMHCPPKEVASHEEQKCQKNSPMFPLPTPLSRRTFGLPPVSKMLSTPAKEEQNESQHGKAVSSLPPPRSASFAHRDSLIDGDKYETISQMPYFSMYSVEEIRLWDYVVGDKGWGGL